MRVLPRAVVVFAAVSVVGCESSTGVKPEQQETMRLSPLSAVAAVGTGKPEIDPTYANGQTVYMIGPHLIVNARAPFHRLLLVAIGQGACGDLVPPLIGCTP